MENHFTNEEKPNYLGRRIATLLVVAIFFTFLGRHLTFLPTVNLSMQTKEEDLKTEVEKIIEEKKGSYSVYYKNLDTGSSFGIDENLINKGASVNKIPIIASLYFLEKSGKINMDERVTINEEDVQDYGTGSIRYQEIPVNYSLRNLAKLALKQSDNTASHVINLKIGEENVQKLVNSWGMTQTNMAENKTTVKDMTIIFEKIYRNEITDIANTKELLDFMTDTEFEDRITKDLPREAVAYHKSGDDEGYIHDVGIIKSPKGTYYLGIMTSDIGGNEDETKNTMSQISKLIFDSLNN
jgi:beta-lactamase class A